MAIPAEEPPELLEVRLQIHAPETEPEAKPERSPETKAVIARGNMIATAIMDLICMLALVYLNVGLQWALDFVPEGEHTTTGVAVMETISWVATDVTAGLIILKDVVNTALYLWGKGD